MSLSTPDVFPFPYATPYPIQLQLMQHIYHTLEHSHLAIVQSPTGTGKSLSLLTGTLTWLRDDHARATSQALATYQQELEQEADPSDPPWMLPSLLARKRREIEQTRVEADARLASLRQVELENERRREFGEGEQQGRKRKKLTVALEDSDDRFLPSSSSTGQESDIQRSRDDLKEGEMYLSSEVRALMAQMAPKPIEDEALKVGRQIYFTSRTHSQLSQVFSELRKTTFASSPPPSPSSSSTEAPAPAPQGASSSSLDETSPQPIRALALGSRKNLCINPSVLKGGPSGLDERCLDLQSTPSSCSFLPSNSDGAFERGKGKEFGEKILSRVRDIEDLRELGEREGCCSYYASRSVIPQAEIIALPYNLLLHPSARDTLKINLKDNVVVVDEAHNLIDTVLSLHSVTTTSSALGLAKTQLETYLAKFGGRLKSTNLVRLKQTLGLLKGLLSVTSSFATSSEAKSGKLLDVLTLMGQMGKGLDQVNLLEVVKWLGEARMAVKVSGYAEKLLDDEIATNLSKDPSRASKLSALKHSSIASFHTFTSLLLSLSSKNADGRILLSLLDGSNPGKGVGVKYLLLNPMEMFRDVVGEARSVVLAGGTMEPVSDFSLQLLPQLAPSQIANFSCGHVIPSENILTVVIPKGPKGKEMEFKFSGREDEGLMEELGATLSNACNLVPDGIVVFFPSYAFLDKVKTLWTRTGLLEKLNAKKTVFYEPQAGGSVETVLAEYTNAILTASTVSTGPSTSGRATKKTGAILFAVVGAKLSEGINFSDRLARAVVMVGLPFPNLTSPELKERMRYVEELASKHGRNGKEAGRELYMNLCMKAVNQSIGRAIRHANDYAVLILVDKRYSQPSIRARLPGWIMGEQVIVSTSFGEGVKALAGFFRGKKGK